MILAPYISIRVRKEIVNMSVKDFPKVTVILRGYTYSQIRTVVKNLIGTELKAVEITMNTPGRLFDLFFLSFR